jgi:hypothetical protein
MKIDIRQIMDIFDDCGYILMEKGKPQSKAYWNVDSVYEFENGFKKVTVSFTSNPTDGYLSSMSPARNKKKLPITLDMAQFVVLNKESDESSTYELDLRNSGREEMDRLERLLTFV